MVPSPAQLARPLTAVRGNDRPAVGGKAATLGELTAAGVPVPAGFAVTTAAYRLVVAGLDPDGALGAQSERLDPADRAGIAAVTAWVREAILATPIPADVRDAIITGYRALAGEEGRGAPVAVHSSATVEDGESASFAGLQDTYLWVQGEDAEFLVDPGRGAFYFLEMNAHIQVEHPVTEQVCGLDLVAEQIALAEGRPLSLAQEEITVTGHAIECRICAEDAHGRPAPGTITRAVFPAGPGIRVDTGIQAGSAVPPLYDSLLAKLIVTGDDRAAAVTRLRRALAACEIDGVATNLPQLARLAGDPGFAAGGADTGFLARLTRDAAVAARG